MLGPGRVAPQTLTAPAVAPAAAVRAAGARWRPWRTCAAAQALQRLERMPFSTALTLRIMAVCTDLDHVALSWSSAATGHLPSECRRRRHGTCGYGADIFSQTHAIYCAQGLACAGGNAGGELRHLHQN